MQSTIRALEAERARLLAKGESAAAAYPRIIIPDAGPPPVVLQNLGQPGRAVLIRGRRQPASWSETHWLAGQGDGTYLATLDGRTEIIRVEDGVVKTFVLDDIKKWTPVGRVARTEGENLEHPVPAPPSRPRRGFAPGAGA